MQRNSHRQPGVWRKAIRDFPRLIQSWPCYQQLYGLRRRGRGGIATCVLYP